MHAETSLVPESPLGGTWTSFWSLLCHPHLISSKNNEMLIRMYFAEIFEKTHVFGIPEPFRTHFKFRSIFEQILQGTGCLPCGTCDNK